MNVEEWLDNNKFSIDIWKNKYQFNSEETLDEWFDRVSGGDQDVRRLIVEKKFLFGGRVLANRGINDRKVSLNNCYVLAPPEDNIESLYNTAKKMARTFSYSGGVGISLDKVAPNGSKVNNAAKTSSGVVSFCELYNTTGIVIGSNGRRSALMLSLSCDHPDIEEFVDAKIDTTKLTKCNMSTMMSDEFMEIVDLNSQPCCITKLYETKFTRETGDIIIKYVNPREIFKKLVYNNWLMGEPGLIFSDRINNWSMLSDNPDFKVAGLNPCVSPDTVILTNKGYVRIDSVENKLTTVWNGYEWSDVTPQVTGHDQDLMLITFSDGSELKCTPYHKFVLKNGKRIEAQDLHVGQKLTKYEFPIIDGTIAENNKLMYTKGFYSGDGFFDNYHNTPAIWLYDEKVKLFDKLVYITKQNNKNDKKIYIKLDKSLNYDKTFVPNCNYSIENRLAWLSGIIDSDGCKNSLEGSVSISSIDKQFLMNIKYMLNTLGINTHVAVMKKAGKRLLPDSDRNLKEYNCVESYRLIISSTCVRKLLDMGLTLYRVNVNPYPNRDAGRFIVIRSVELLKDKVDKVYCFNEPKNHTGCFNGIVTAQCGEMPLPAGGACALCSINLIEYIKDNKFDFESFKNDIPIIVKAMNDVIDEGIPKHPLKEQQETVAKWRQIGVGIFSWASTLMKLGIKYGSEESLELADKIAKMMINESARASALLTKEYGTFPAYNYEYLIKSKFYQDNIDQDIKDLIALYGLRNSQLLSIAPTGSLSSLFGVSGGIEPLFNTAYNRKTQSLHNEDTTYKVYDKTVEEIMKDLNITDEKDLPDYVICSQDIPYLDRIKMQAVWQQYIDASISSTVNLPNSATQDDIYNLYIEAWKAGLKGITVYRAGCAREGILTTDTTTPSTSELKRGEWKALASDAKGDEPIKLRTGCGKLELFPRWSESENCLQEVWLKKAGKGGCGRSLDAIAIEMSGILRLGGSLENVKKSFEGLEVCPSYASAKASGKKLSPGTSCADSILKALQKFEASKKKSVDNSSSEDIYVVANACPECGTELIATGGCWSCINCTYSKCE